MKLFFRFIFLCLLTVLPLLGEAPHLMLYFDINKTLIASDKAGGKSVEDVLNELLACKFEDTWDSSIPEPISYDSYLRNVVFPGSEVDPVLKNTRKAYLTHFLDYLKEQNHPLYSEAQLTYNIALQKLKSSRGTIFPSFYKLLNMLDREGISYTLVLRSFGLEVFDVANEINSFHPDKIEHFGEFKAGILLIDNHILAADPAEIYKLLISLNHIAIHDDYSYWMAGEMKSQFGKPFILDQGNRKVLGIFFDDNIEITEIGTNIIAPIDVNTGKSIALDVLVAHNQVARVDTLEAILNEQYFIELVLKALQSQEQGHSYLSQESAYD